MEKRLEHAMGLGFIPEELHETVNKARSLVHLNEIIFVWNVAHASKTENEHLSINWRMQELEEAYFKGTESEKMGILYGLILYTCMSPTDFVNFIQPEKGTK